jgi:hypothetical protein
MKKFFTQQINFAYAVIVMLLLVVGLGTAHAANLQQSSGYAQPGEASLSIIHQGGGEQVINNLRIGANFAPIGKFAVQQDNLATAALFESNALTGLFAVLEDAVFLGTLNIAEDMSSAVAFWAAPHNGLYSPLQRVNVNGDVLATNLIHSDVSKDVCVTKDGTIVLCPETILGSCGNSAGHSYSTPPSTYLCSSGTASSVTTNTSTYNWSCVGTGGSTSCQANRIIPVNALCGSASGQTYSGSPTSNLCAPGTPGSVTTNPNTYDWTCYGSGGGSDLTCQANRTTEIDGECKEYINGPYNTQPGTNTANACDAGTYSDTPSDIQASWQWSCLGVNGGTDDTPCTAARPASPIDGVCQNYPSAPTVQNACDAGTPNDSAIGDTANLWRWRCDGINSGADSGTCQLAKPLPECSYYSGPQANDPGSNPSSACTAGSYEEYSDTATDWRWKCVDSGVEEICSAEIADGHSFICGVDPTAGFPPGNTIRRSQWTKDTAYQTNGPGNSAPYGTMGSFDCGGAVAPPSASSLVWVPTNPGMIGPLPNPLGSDDLYYQYYCFDSIPDPCVCKTNGQTTPAC